jgi:hypothetical protein
MTTKNGFDFNVESITAAHSILVSFFPLVIRGYGVLSKRELSQINAINVDVKNRSIEMVSLVRKKCMIITQSLEVDDVITFRGR